jgi:uncharacterized repeat protein (TIGR04076 family)
MATPEENANTMRRILREVGAGTRKMDDDTQNELAGLKTNYDVAIKVKSWSDICPAGHRVGDEWIVKGNEDGYRTPNICLLAFSAIYPSLQMLMFGGSFPWEPNPDIVLVPCPDARNPMVFELKRIREE